MQAKPPLMAVTVLGLTVLGFLIAGGCSAAKNGGLGFPGMAQQRVSPPGTGTYAAPDHYYRGPESVATPNNLLQNQPNQFAAAPVGSGVTTASYAAPPANSDLRQIQPTQTGTSERRSQYRGMPVIDLTPNDSTFTQAPSPPPMFRGQDSFSGIGETQETQRTANSKPTPVPGSSPANSDQRTATNLQWQSPSGI